MHGIYLVCTFYALVYTWYIPGSGDSTHQESYVYSIRQLNIQYYMTGVAGSSLKQSHTRLELSCLRCFLSFAAVV
jgi:hypothetical protein